MWNVPETENNAWPKNLKGKCLTTELSWPEKHQQLPSTCLTGRASQSHGHSPEWPRSGSSWHLWAAHTRWTRGAGAAPRAELGVNSQHPAQAPGVTPGSSAAQPLLLLPLLHTLSSTFTPSAPLSALQCSHSCSTGCGKLSWHSNCSQSWAHRNGPEPAETRDPQSRSLASHCVPKRRNSWYQPSFNLSSHQSTSSTSTSFHRQRGLLTVFCYLTTPEHFKREQLPKDWPSSHGRDNPSWAGIPSPDSMLAQLQGCQYLPAPANTLRIQPPNSSGGGTQAPGRRQVLLLTSQFFISQHWH